MSRIWPAASSSPPVILSCSPRRPSGSVADGRPAADGVRIHVDRHGPGRHHAYDRGRLDRVLEVGVGRDRRHPVIDAEVERLRHPPVGVVKVEDLTHRDGDAAAHGRRHADRRPGRRVQAEVGGHLVDVPLALSIRERDRVGRAVLLDVDVAGEAGQAFEGCPHGRSCRVPRDGVGGLAAQGQREVAARQAGQGHDLRLVRDHAAGLVDAPAAVLDREQAVEQRQAGRRRDMQVDSDAEVWRPAE